MGFERAGMPAPEQSDGGMPSGGRRFAHSAKPVAKSHTRHKGLDLANTTSAIIPLPY